MYAGSYLRTRRSALRWQSHSRRPDSLNTPPPLPRIPSTMIVRIRYVCGTTGIRQTLSRFARDVHYKLRSDETPAQLRSIRTRTPSFHKCAVQPLRVDPSRDLLAATILCISNQEGREKRRGR
jgi:hypothetical protein